MRTYGRIYLWIQYIDVYTRHDCNIRPQSKLAQDTAKVVSMMYRCMDLDKCIDKCEEKEEIRLTNALSLAYIMYIMSRSIAALHKKRERETERQREKARERERERERERWIERKREKEREIEIQREKDKERERETEKTRHHIRIVVGICNIIYI